MKSTDPIAAQSSAISPSDSNNGTSILTPKETLSGAITAAAANGQSGDTIIVGPGEFTDSNLTVSENLTIQGAGRELTIFKRTGGSAAGFMAIKADVTLKDMTIRDYDTGAGGGALHLGNDWSATTHTNTYTINIENILFVNNRSSYGGGAIAVPGAQNTSSYFYVNIKECLFYDNYSTAAGGAIYSYEHVWMDIENSVFADNTSNTLGGAIYFGDSEVDTALQPMLKVENCTFYRNWGKDFDADNGGAIYTYTDSNSGSGDYLRVFIYNSILQYNVTGPSVNWGGSYTINDLNGYVYGRDTLYDVENSAITDYGRATSTK